MMEEVVGAFFRGTVQAIGYIIGEVLCKYLLQYTGAVALKILSAGSYPKVLDEEPFDSISGTLMILLGLIIWISGFIYFW